MSLEAARLDIIHNDPTYYGNHKNTAGWIGQYVSRNEIPTTEKSVLHDIIDGLEVAMCDKKVLSEPRLMELAVQLEQYLGIAEIGIRNAHPTDLVPHGAHEHSAFLHSLAQVLDWRVPGKEFTVIITGAIVEILDGHSSGVTTRIQMLGTNLDLHHLRVLRDGVDQVADCKAYVHSSGAGAAFRAQHGWFDNRVGLTLQRMDRELHKRITMAALDLDDVIWKCHGLRLIRAPPCLDMFWSMDKETDGKDRFDAHFGPNNPFRRAHKIYKYAGIVASGCLPVNKDLELQRAVYPALLCASPKGGGVAWHQIEAWSNIFKGLPISLYQWKKLDKAIVSRFGHRGVCTDPPRPNMTQNLTSPCLGRRGSQYRKVQDLCWINKENLQQMSNQGARKNADQMRTTVVMERESRAPMSETQIEYMFEDEDIYMPGVNMPGVRWGEKKKQIMAWNIEPGYPGSTEPDPMPEMPAISAMAGMAAIADVLGKKASGWATAERDEMWEEIYKESLTWGNQEKFEETEELDPEFAEWIREQNEGGRQFAEELERVMLPRKALYQAYMSYLRQASYTGALIEE